MAQKNGPTALPSPPAAGLEQCVYQTPVCAATGVNEYTGVNENGSGIGVNEYTGVNENGSGIGVNEYTGVNA